MNLPVSYHGRVILRLCYVADATGQRDGSREMPATSCCSDIALGATLLTEVRQPAFAMGIVGSIAGIVHSFAPSLFQVRRHASGPEGVIADPSLDARRLRPALDLGVSVGLRQGRARQGPRAPTDGAKQRSLRIARQPTCRR
jgi:hypothetical protein